MNSVSGVNFTGKEQGTSNRTSRHLGNMAVTTAGLATTGLLMRKGVKKAAAVCNSMIEWTNSEKYNSNGIKQLKSIIFTGPVYDKFEKMGSKLFGEKTKIGGAIERFVTGKDPKTGGFMANPEQIAAVVKKYKTVAAMGLVAGVVALGLFVRSIYKAGKINADK